MLNRLTTIAIFAFLSCRTRVFLGALEWREQIPSNVSRRMKILDMSKKENQATFFSLCYGFSSFYSNFFARFALDWCKNNGSFWTCALNRITHLNKNLSIERKTIGLNRRLPARNKLIYSSRVEVWTSGSDEGVFVLSCFMKYFSRKKL